MDSQALRKESQIRRESQKDPIAADKELEKLLKKKEKNDNLVLINTHMEKILLAILAADSD